MDAPSPFENFSLHPDVPFQNYVQGQLGIVRPSFARSYLVVAYRYFNGVPLTKDEQEGALALWIDRSRQFDFLPDGVAPQTQNSYLQKREQSAAGPKEWLGRAQVVSSAIPQVDQMQGGDHFADYLNCSNAGLANATTTLNMRIAKFGKDHPGIREWVAAQDAVFANCSGDPDNPVLPAAPAASLPALLRFDREYQIAAAYMYSNHYDQAEQAFQHIAEENDSPWRDIAPYLVARCMFRRANGGEPPGPQSFSKMRAAVDYIHKLLADAPNRPFALPLQALLDRAEFRLDPEEQTVRLSGRLSNPAPAGQFYQWLWDYTWLLDQRADATGDFGRQADATEYEKLTAERRKDPLTDWVVTLQMEYPVASEHALEVWRMHRESLPWLIAALSKADPSSPQVSELLSAADRVPATSPAYVTVFYHRMRLRNGLHNFNDVRRSIDSLLASSKDLPSVARDAILDLRLDAAADLNDAVHFLPRQACSVDNRAAPPNCPGTMPEHPARYLDALPLDTLMQILGHKDLPDQEKSKFVQNVWMRAVLLGRHDLAQSLDAQLFVFRPGTDQWPVPPEVVAKLVKEYESASTPAERQFAAVFLLQHQYAFGYQMGVTNPWCASAVFKDEQAYWRYSQPSGAPLPAPQFLSDSQRREAEADQAVLNEADSQANYYTKVVLDYAEKHPDDPRIPEALSRAVKNTRMNCNNSRTGTLCKAAFDLLHKRYPETTWAKNTKYWYGSGY